VGSEMISDRFKNVILKELKLDEWNIQDDTLANQVPGWDSLKHVDVILAIEKEYSIRFKGVEVLKCKNIGDLQKLVDSKIK
jgi:acyl carrier protein